MKRILPLMIITSLVLNSCQDKDSASTQIEIPTAIVVTKVVENNQRNQMIHTSGKVASEQSATISTRIMGNIKNLPVNIGDKLSKGQLLVHLDDKDLQAKFLQTEAGISQAKANLKNTEINYHRIKNLFDSKSASQKELDDISTQLEMAKSQLDIAIQQKTQVLSQINYTKIRAPFDGIITAKMIKAGDIANPGMPLLIIENNHKLEVVTSIPESDISSINDASEVEIHIPSLDKKFKGSIKELSKSSKQNGGQYQAIISLNENSDQLLSGMFAKVSFYILDKNLESSVFIDKKAVFQKGQLTGVYTVSHKNTAILRWIQTGAEKNDAIEVISGLNHGETYIVSSEQKLFNGINLTTK